MKPEFPKLFSNIPPGLNSHKRS